MDKERGGVTEFNDALATLRRIDTLLVKINEASTLGDHAIHQRLLHTLWKEINPFLKGAEKKEALKEWNDIKDIIQIEGKRVYYNPQAEAELHDFDFWLRDKLESHGLLMPKGEDPSNAFGGRK